MIFPFPRTQKWFEVPLFVEGIEGVWILQPARGQTLGAGALVVPDVPNAFTALDPLDFHAPGVLGRIETCWRPPSRPRRDEADAVTDVPIRVVNVIPTTLSDETYRPPRQRHRRESSAVTAAAPASRTTSATTRRSFAVLA